MKEQPEKENQSWEELTTRLLQLYAQEMIKFCKESDYTAPEVSTEGAQLRATIRAKIVEIGTTLDETEKQYKALIEEYGKEEITVEHGKL
jgi:hypothetical protein